MHCVMGLGNQLYNELDKVTKNLDANENRIENQDYKVNIEELLSEKNVELEEKEDMHANNNLARLVIINDLERLPLLVAGNEKAAEAVAKRNYASKKSRRKRATCDSEICLLFPVDMDNDWDAKFVCINGCNIHVRCEGLVPVDENERMPENYLCHSCRSETGNKSWLEQKLKGEKEKLTVKIVQLEREINKIKMHIEKLENEDSKFGPRQKILKESARSLNINPARYHGGDMEGKAVQDLLGCARDRSFEILRCISDKPEQKRKFERALTNLQQVNDILKNKDIGSFDDEDMVAVRSICEQWGKDFPFDFPHLNLTPKAHILSFVLPKIVEKTRSFSKFYAMEEKGEQIHAELNDIERKIW